MSQPAEQVTVFFADIGGSTALYQSQGDAKAHEIVTGAMRDMAALVDQHDGELLRTIGDEVLAVFPGPSDAFFCALSMQHAFSQKSLGLRVGFNHGEVIRDSGDVYGHAVNLAARLASLAKIDEIITSAATVSGFGPGVLESAACETVKLDAIDFKGVSEKVEVHRIIESEATRTAMAGRTARRTTGRAPVFSLALHITHAGQVYPLTEGKLTLGRSPGCDVQVDVVSASRNHGMLELKNNKFYFTDESSNGSWYCRHGESPVRLLRETTIITGHGVLGIGFLPEDLSPDSDVPGALRFQITAQILSGG